MLRAGLFPDFKSADTLLVWGDAADIEGLHRDVPALHDGLITDLTIAEQAETHRLTIVQADDHALLSMLTACDESGTSFRWACSPFVITYLKGMVEGLLRGTGHQFLKVDGRVASQVVISNGEYPASLRP